MTSINYVLICIILICNSSFIKAQTNPDSIITINSQLELNTHDIEKVYLQSDRNHYVSGETIWFKAYLVNALNNEFSNNSKCLYVELLSPELKILKRNVIRMENGTGFGDFSLKDTLHSGKYLIRAYTNWMRNFSDYFIFTKEIELVNPRDKKIISNDNIGEGITDSVDLQFFPEGGSLLDGVMSRVGFKATNSHNRGCKVSGKLVSSLGDSVASFESNRLGMGSFFIIPQKELQYHVVLSDSKKLILENNFPAVMPTGYVLQIIESGANKVILSVNTNDNTLAKYHNQKLKLSSEFRGKQILTASLKLKSTYGHFLLEKDKFPEGIIRFTIRDKQDRPWCERLFYFDQKKQFVVNVESDKESYSPHEKVTLTISVKDTADKPVQANLSLAATDAYISGANEIDENNIYSYFMLESDIHGFVEQASYYFDTLNSQRFKDLDLLLLTQGWRDFVWKHFTDTVIPLKYQNETGITISGELHTLLTHKPKTNTAISLALNNNNQTIFDLSKTDSLGRYKFDNLDFNDTCNVTVSAFNSKHNAAGEISINSIFSEPMDVNSQQMRLNYSLTSSELAEDSEDFASYLYTNYADSMPTIAIEEVTVIDDRVIKKDYINPYYSDPDWTHEVALIDYSYLNVLEYMNGRVAGLKIGKDSNGDHYIAIRGEAALILLDGMETDVFMLESVPMSIIDKIDVSKIGVGTKTAGGVVSVYTKKGEKVPPPKLFNSNNKTVIGFYEARVFYAPKYETPDSVSKKPDSRSTIFWQPTVITNQDGKAIINFYNDDMRKYIDVKVEGIAGNSVPIVGKTSYLVE